ncbi:MAG: hypothetical protein EAZ85_01640 [Bacteroidetes bacterium]|nr:MAG: hypothetical protein EAZ85_01640 [Bacteroidota bacterium]
MQKIYLSPPHLTGEEGKYFEEVLASGWIAPMGTFIDEFENQISQKIGAKHTLATNSGTSALHLALCCADIRAGDYVLVSSFSFVASANPILYQNAIPIFVDSDEKSWNICPISLEKALINCQQKQIFPKALVLTHLYGQAADMDAVMKIVEKYNLILIEDAAESLGCTWDNQFVGTFGKYGFFSFNGNKIITTSAGGMLVLPNENQRKKALFLATQAKDDAPHYQHSEIGYNYRMSNVLAAMGVAQMKFLDKKIQKKKEIFNFYQQNLSKNIVFMPELEKSKGNRWLTCVLFQNFEQREKIRQVLNQHNIESRPLWKPLHLQPLFSKNLYFGENISEKLFEKGLCLPSGTQINYHELEIIIQLINQNC